MEGRRRVHRGANDWSLKPETWIPTRSHQHEERAAARLKDVRPPGVRAGGARASRGRSRVGGEGGAGVPSLCPPQCAQVQGHVNRSQSYYQASRTRNVQRSQRTSQRWGGDRGMLLWYDDWSRQTVEPRRGGGNLVLEGQGFDNNVGHL